MLRKIADLAIQSPDAEICGVIILNKNSGLADVVSVPNVATSAVAEFIMDPTTWVKLQKDVAYGRNSSFQLIGRFHSHPYWAAYPSITDKIACVYNQLEIIYSNVMDDFICYTNFKFLQRAGIDSQGLLRSFVDDESEVNEELPSLHRVNFNFSEGNYFENYSDWCRWHRFVSSSGTSQVNQDSTAT